jgi:predicted PurR-regulated permease PerM
MSSNPLWPSDGKGSDQKKGPVPVKKEVASSQDPTAELLDLEEGVQEVHEELRKATITQITLTTFAVLAICYVAKLVLVTIFTSILIAFILEPIVRILGKIRIPRAVGSGIAVLLLLGILYGLSYFFFQRAVDFAHQIPQMSGEIKKVVAKYQTNAEKIRQSTQSVIPPSQADKNAVPVKVQQDTGIRGLISGSGIANVGEVLLIVAFIPFLVYFMLTWQEHTRRATVRLFPIASRANAYRTLGKISDMMRGFIVGNFVIGIFMAIFSGMVFAFLHLPYFYFLGLISGFLSLIPYLGVVLAILPPIASGAGVLHGSGMMIIAVMILGLHVFSMNVLYPKVIGGRLELNPLAVTLGLLIWGWIWGAMGLILAVPVVGAIKIVCDNVEGLEPFGNWLGEGQEAQKKGAKA